MKSSTDKKKVKVKAFEPTMRVYFVLMVVFAAVTAIFDYRVAAAEGVVVVALFIVFLSTAVKRKKHILDQLHTITSNVDAAGESGDSLPGGRGADMPALRQIARAYRFHS